MGSLVRDQCSDPSVSAKAVWKVGSEMLVSEQEAQ